MFPNDFSEAVGYRNTGDDCLPLCIAYILDLHPLHVPYISPHEYDNEEFWDHYRNFLLSIGKSFVFWEEKYIENVVYLLHRKKMWIAIVDTIPKESVNAHAIVMKGKKVEFDPDLDNPRTRTPKKYHCAASIWNI